MDYLVLRYTSSKVTILNILIREICPAADTRSAVIRDFFPGRMSTPRDFFRNNTVF